MVSDRTTAMITGPTDHPPGKVKGSAQKQLDANEKHYLDYPDARFTGKFRTNVAVAHAGVAIQVSTPDDTIYVTDLINIPPEKNITLTTAEHGVWVSRPEDDELGSGHLAAGGIYHFNDPELYDQYLTN